MTKYLCDFATKTLKEVATMEKPSCYNGGVSIQSELCELCCKYDNHLASLKQYSMPSMPLEWDGQVKELGKDFELKDEFCQYVNDQWGQGYTAKIAHALPLTPSPDVEKGAEKYFDERKLRKEIAGHWGGYGAHVEVFDTLYSKAMQLELLISGGFIKEEKLAEAKEIVESFPKPSPAPQEAEGVEQDALWDYQMKRSDESDDKWRSVTKHTYDQPTSLDKRIVNNEAIVFKDWCDKNRYELEMRAQTSYTTSELYSIFKSQFTITKR